jgi:uncharacterized protein (TIGR03435 family)
MRRVGVAALIAIAVTCAAVVAAQDAARFAVTSVKPNRSGPGPRDAGFGPDGRFIATNVPVRVLIAIAYGRPQQPLADFQVVGGPDWASSDHFDVAATVEGSQDSSGPAPEMLTRLRSLLADRFGLVAHRETRTLPVYALRLDRSDRKLGRELRLSGLDCGARQNSGDVPAGDPPPCGAMLAPGLLASGGMTMEQFATALSRFVNRVVVDQTRLKGYYEAQLEFTPDRVGGLELPPDFQPPPTDAPSLFTALREQLGLRLVSTRGPVSVLVIDRIDHPAAN